MTTRRNNNKKKTKTRNNRKKTRNNRKNGKKSNAPIKWLTAIEAAQQSLEKTGSVTKAHKVLNNQALLNARKIFGSVGTTGGS